MISCKENFVSIIKAKLVSDNIALTTLKFSIFFLALTLYNSCYKIFLVHLFQIAIQNLIMENLQDYLF